jgi:3-deoxy-D-manno-octulosonate 8-phosphate phosphatase (KDO 8-P phosphatase)
MDGVLTDGTVLVMAGGEWVRRMHIRDGYILQLAVRTGYKVIVITGSSSAPVEERLRKLGVTDIYQSVNDKLGLLRELMTSLDITPVQVLYMGDDIPDLDAMRAVGLACCPADAARDILEMAHYISPVKGGEGCVRDVIEKLMRVQDKWQRATYVSST